MAIFGDILRPVFSASRVQQVSDLHLKVALLFFPRLILAAADWMSAVLPHKVWPYDMI